jgi:hypothetical protein
VGTVTAHQGDLAATAPGRPTAIFGGPPAVKDSDASNYSLLAPAWPLWRPLRVNDCRSVLLPAWTDSAVAMRNGPGDGRPGAVCGPAQYAINVALDNATLSRWCELRRWHHPHPRLPDDNLPNSWETYGTNPTTQTSQIFTYAVCVPRRSSSEFPWVTRHCPTRTASIRSEGDSNGFGIDTGTAVGPRPAPLGRPRGVADTPPLHHRARRAGAPRRTQPAGRRRRCRPRTPSRDRAGARPRWA